MGLGLAVLARRCALAVAACCSLLLDVLAWSRLYMAFFGSSFLFLVIVCLGLPLFALASSCLCLSVAGYCWPLWFWAPACLGSPFCFGCFWPSLDVVAGSSLLVPVVSGYF